LKFLEIEIDELIVNPSNDRHGPTPSEEAAILWLFQNKPKEMEKLASKISAAGRVFDSPLVVPQGKKYLVKVSYSPMFGQVLA
jgi:predicted P-loop ATPase/GTPase